MITIATTVRSRGPYCSHTAAAGRDTIAMVALVVASRMPAWSVERSNLSDSCGTSGTNPFHSTSPAKIERYRRTAAIRRIPRRMAER